jgi:hypothetical protein
MVNMTFSDVSDRLSGRAAFEPDATGVLILVHNLDFVRIVRPMNRIYIVKRLDLRHPEPIGKNIPKGKPTGKE